MTRTVDRGWKAETVCWGRGEKVLGWFRKSRKAAPTPATFSAPDKQNPHFIHGPDEMLKILRDLCHASTVVSLYFPERPQQGYGSSLIEVGRGALLLDQVNHPEGHAQLLAEKSFRALSKYKGVTVTFDCRLLGLTESEDGLRYRVAFPERIYYPQLREFFRIQVQSLKLPLHIRGRDEAGNEETVVGRVEDLGPNGIGFVLESDLFIRKLDVLRYCVLRIEEDRQLTFDVQVRNVRPWGRGGRIRVGARFVNLSKRNAGLIRREITRLQRRLRDEGT